MMRCSRRKLFSPFLAILSASHSTKTAPELCRACENDPSLLVEEIEDALSAQLPSPPGGVLFCCAVACLKAGSFREASLSGSVSSAMVGCW